METNTENTKSTKSKILSWVAVAVGVVVLGLGTYGVIPSNWKPATDSVAVVAIQEGVSNNPDTVPYLEEATHIIDTAISARSGDTSKLKQDIVIALTELQVKAPVAGAEVISAVVIYVNTAFPEDAKEADAIAKLEVLNKRIQSIIAPYKKPVLVE